MKITTTVAMIAATILTTAPASAQRYAVVSEGPDTSIMAVDLDTIRKVEASNRAWVLTVLKSPTEDAYYSLLSLDEFDCVEEKSRSLTTKVYNEKSEPVTTTGIEPWAYKLPKSVGYNALKVACGKAPSPGTVVNATTSEFSQNFITYVRAHGKK